MDEEPEDLDDTVVLIDVLLELGVAKGVWSRDAITPHESGWQAVKRHVVSLALRASAMTRGGANKDEAGDTPDARPSIDHRIRDIAVDEVDSESDDERDGEHGESDDYFPITMVTRAMVTKRLSIGHA